MRSIQQIRLKGGFMDSEQMEAGPEVDALVAEKV
jgi:hypothetical protein